MAVMICYTDVSGSMSELVISPAMLVSSPEKWKEFDKRWGEFLAVFGVSALHMKDFAHSLREFESWKFDEPRRRRFLRGLLRIIEDLVEYTAAVAVYGRDFNFVDSKFRLSESMRPYTMGCLGCASRIVDWAKKEQHSKNDLAWVFEKGDRDQNDLRKHWNIAYPEATVDPIFLSKSDKHPGHDAVRSIRPFEAADFIAYENLQAHRLIEKKQGSQIFEDLRVPMQKMFEFPGADKWGYLSGREMLSMCSEWGIPSR